MVTVVFTYAPQSGLSGEKDHFYDELVTLGGDLHGHVGQSSDGYNAVNGKNGFGLQNLKGEMILKFADAIGMVGCNTLFTKRNSRLVTCQSDRVESN